MESKTKAAKKPKTKTSKVFVLDLEDEDTAAWIAINNAFTGTGASNLGSSKYWNGILMLLGGYKILKTPHLVQYDLESVILKKGNTDVLTIAAADFADPANKISINIVNDKQGRDDPMPDRDKILLDGQTFNGCFHPYRGGITFWFHRKGITITSKVGKSDHAGYEFAVKKANDFRVEVHGWADDPVFGGNDIDRIVIKSKASNGGGHDDHNEPPQMGPPL